MVACQSIMIFYNNGGSPSINWTSVTVATPSGYWGALAVWAADLVRTSAAPDTTLVCSSPGCCVLFVCAWRGVQPRVEGMCCPPYLSHAWLSFPFPCICGCAPPTCFTSITDVFLSSCCLSMLWFGQNKDGRMDIASANPENKTVTWYANGGGTLPTWTNYTMAAAASTDGVRSIVLADGASLGSVGLGGMWGCWVCCCRDSYCRL